MNCHNETAAVSTPLVRLMTWLALALLLGAPAHAIDSGDIVVASVKGQVSVTMNGAARGVRAGSVLELPATVRTGPDGAIELKQGATSVSVGPDTQLDFPALEKRGAPVDRIVQPRGNAFYDIGKREGRKLRVETPYLVGVIKGTQFNVAAHADSTTISLFEGRLEILGGDDDDAVDLRAGEIASRKRGDKSISVIKMNEKAPAAAPVSQSRGGDDNQGGAEATPPFALADVGHGTPDAGPVVVETDVRASVDAGGGAVSVDTGLSAGVDVGNAASVDTGVSAAVEPGGGAVSVDAGLSTGVDVSTAVSVDVGANTGVDVAGNGVSVDVGTAADLTAGGVTTTIDMGAGVDLGTGGVSVSVDVDAGVVAGADDVAAVDAGLDLAANVGAGAIDVDTAVDVNANVAGVDAGVNAGVDVGAGTVDLGVNVGTIDVGLGIDLGLDGDNGNDNGNPPVLDNTSNPADSAPSTPGDVIEDVGGLLDGLLRRPGRR